jgi:hypothetical protein
MPPRPRGRHPLTLEELREQLSYSKKTGWLRWKVSKPRIRKGSRAGSLHCDGHREITVCGFVFREHRLIWWLVTGKDPGDNYIDHKNRVRNNNKWTNLRPASHGQNYVNSTKFGLMRGINKRSERSYRVRSIVDGKRCSFHVKTLKQAVRLRRRLERQEWGEFACVRKSI